MGKFGEMLKKTIKFSGIKYAAIAQKINFDASYISKWINADLLPSSKIIVLVCTEYSKLLLTSLDTQEIPSLCKLMDIEYDASYNYNTLKEHIYNKIMSCYQQDYERKHHETYSCTPSENTISSSEMINKQRQKIIFRKLDEYRKTSSAVHILIVGELFSCSAEEIIFLMDIKMHLSELQFSDITFQVIISESCMRNESSASTNIAILNLFMVPFDVKINYCSAKIENCGLVISVENLFVYHAQIFCGGNWALSSFIHIPDEVNAFHDVLKSGILSISRELFEIHDCTAPESFDVMRHIFGSLGDRMVISSIDYFLLNAEVLTYLLDELGTYSADFKTYCIKKHNINLNRLEKGEKIRCVIYRDAFDKFIYQGIMRLIGQEIVIPMDLRFRILQYIDHLIETFPNLEIRVIDNFLIDEIKHKPLPNLYLSPVSGFFLMAPVNGMYQFCYLKNKHLKSSFSKTFDLIWDHKLVPLISGEHVIKEYLDICQEAFFLEFM